MPLPPRWSDSRTPGRALPRYCRSAGGAPSLSSGVELRALQQGVQSPSPCCGEKRSCVNGGGEDSLWRAWGKRKLDDGDPRALLTFLNASISPSPVSSPGENHDLVGETATTPATSLPSLRCRLGSFVGPSCCRHCGRCVLLGEFILLYLHVHHQHFIIVDCWSSSYIGGCFVARSTVLSPHMLCHVQFVFVI